MSYQDGEKVQGKIIQAGYDWMIQISFTNAGKTFPNTATFTSQVRRDPAVEDILATMTTANGGIIWIDESTLALKLVGTATVGWPKRNAYIDVVRTDVTPHEHLGFTLVVPVIIPVTRGLA